MDDNSDDVARPFHRGLLVQPNCDGCPLQGEAIVPPEGNPNATVAIVGDFPGYNEASQGRVFTATVGRLLDVLIHRAGAERSEFWITNAVLCRPKTTPQSNGELLNPDQVARRAAQFCRSRLIGELQIIKPKAIIGFGSESVRSLYGSGASLKGRRGGIHKISLAGTDTSPGSKS